jgi:hypothetical protein
LEEDTKFKASEATSTKNKRWINDKPIFKLVLPPDLAKDLDISSDEILSVPCNPTRFTRSNSAKNSISLPTIEILSSSGEEDLADDYHSSSTTELSNSSVKNNEKPLPEENSSLVNSKKLSPVLDLSTSKRHKSNLLYSMKQKSIQSPKKQVEMDSEDSENSEGDPFGFKKAEKRVRKRNIQSQFSSGNPGKLEVTTIDKESQYNDNVKSEMSKNILLNKETIKNGTNSSSAFSEIEKQENKESNTLSENEKDDDNYQVEISKSQPIHGDCHISTENDKRSTDSGLSPIKSPRDKTKNVEKKNTTLSKVKKPLKSFDKLPFRRQQEHVSKKKD